MQKEDIKRGVISDRAPAQLFDKETLSLGGKLGLAYLGSYVPLVSEASPTLIHYVG